MHIAHFRRVGGSLMIAVPTPLLETLNISIGSAVKIEVDKGRLVMQRTRPKYRLEDLLPTEPVERTAWDIAWESQVAPVGAEII